MMYRLAAALSIVSLAACGDELIVCPDLACEPSLVSVMAADGSPVSAFDGTVTVDGVSLRVACPETGGSDLSCAAGGFLVQGQPRSISVALTSGGLCAAATLALTYPTHDDMQCNARCDGPLEAVSVTLSSCSVPAQTLVVTSAEPAGANCDYAGTRVDSGADTNANGVLDAIEITSTVYACDADPWTTTHIGNLVIADAADLAAFASVKLVVGNLTVDASLGDIPSIETVTGTVTVNCPPERTTLRLPDLRHVVGSVRAGGCYNGALVDLDISRLVTSGGLGLNEGVASVSAPQLRELGALNVINTSVSSLDLPGLVRLDGVTAQNNSALDECTLFSILNRIYAANGGHIPHRVDNNVVCTDDAIRCPALTVGTDDFRVCYRATSAAEADTFCSGLGAGWGLAFVNGPDELDALRDTPILFDLWTLWTGYTDAATEGVFVWPRQKPGVVFAPQTSSEGLWAAGWPNGGDSEDCVALNLAATFEALDHPCSVNAFARPLCRYLAP